MKAWTPLGLALALVVLVGLAGCLGVGPAEDPTPAGDGEPEASDREPGHGYDDGRDDERRLSTDAIRPQPPGTEEAVVRDHGPFLVGPGQDHSRVRLAVPADDVFITEFEARLVDPATGQPPDHGELHLHHAVGFRAEEDPLDPAGTWPLVDWFWATGHERTIVNLTAVADASPEDHRLGVHREGGEAEVVDVMIANPTPEPKWVVLRLERVVVHGTAEAIRDADDCQGAPGDARCRAGETFHDLEPRLWGGFPFDVPREAGGDGTFVWPPDAPLGRTWTDPTTGETAGSPWDGALVFGGGHLHRNGQRLVVANLGPPGSGCEADVDGDGYPGVTVFRSRAEDHPEAAWPHSGSFQMTATQPGWRAPIHEGDRVTLWGTYANRDQAEPDAMAIAGVLVDPEVDPAPADHGDGCDAEALAPRVVGDAPAQPGYTFETRHEHHDGADVCDREGLGADLDGREPCNRPVEDRPDPVPTRTVHIEGFTYAPGGFRPPDPVDRVPRVEQGETLTWVNQDAKWGIRHTVTACRWPCNGATTLNYPQASGLFESGKLGNADPGDDGANGPEDLPTWTLDTSDLEPGLYAYHDRLHPWMRGWFEVVEDGAVAGTR